MSWSMWHINGCGFDMANVKPDKLRSFLKRHVDEQFLANIPFDFDLFMEKVESACEEGADYMLDEARDQTYAYSLAEPIADVMGKETGIRFDHPGVTDEGEDYLLFCPCAYPWSYNEAEKALTGMDDLRRIMEVYSKELGLEFEEDVDLVYAG